MQLTVLTDRSQGGSSLRDGSIELMVSGPSPSKLGSFHQCPPWPLLDLGAGLSSSSLLVAPFCLGFPKLRPPFLCKKFTPCFFFRVRLRGGLG